MELTLGPVLFEWKRDEMLRFYEEAADMDVDTVYVGEVVCSKKRGLLMDDIPRIAERLRRAGKKVALSTLAVVSNEEELDTVRGLLKFPYPIEANDVSVFNMADPSKREVIAGPHITSYNAQTIAFLKGIGVSRFTLPVELSRDSIRHNIAETGITAEVFAHGKVPLAFSWRCYTSRAHSLTKTECRRDCARYPDGMEIKTLEGEPVFTLNGTSVMSARVYSLLDFIDDLETIGVGAIRISPEYKNTAKAVDIFRRRINGITSPEEVSLELKALYPGGVINGWYQGGAGKDSSPARLDKIFS